MNKHFKGYTAKQLLNEDFFIQSMLHPTPQTEKFWAEEKEEDSSLSEEMSKASSMICNIRNDFHQKRLSEEETNSLWKQIQQKNRQKQRMKIWLYSLSAAAVIALLFIVSPLFFKDSATIDYTGLIASVDSIQHSEVQLILSQEEKIVIPETNSKIHYNNQGQVAINNKRIKDLDCQNENKTQQQRIKEVPAKKVELNQLIVPAGKRSFLTLSDGTKVWVNSGTHLIYPSTFNNDKREIYVDGEIYLEVSRDEAKPFLVKTDRLEVKVLGTTFNVCAYKEDVSQSVVLVKGKVQVATEKDKCVIHPSEGFELDKSKGEGVVKEVETEDYIAWINGYYLFKQEPVVTIAKRLSRYYNIQIICDEKIKDLRCSGKLDLNDDFNKVLANFKKALPVKIIYDKESVKIMSN